MPQTKYLIDNSAIFDRNKQTISCKEKTVTISRAEADLLIAFYKGLFKKDELIDYIWSRKGVVVTDASYYKLINSLRNSFAKAGLTSSSVVTRPKVGVILSVSIEPIQNDTSPEEGTEVSSFHDINHIQKENDNKSSIFSMTYRKKWAGVVISFLLMLVLLIYSVISYNDNPYFTPLGTYKNFNFYKVASDKIDFNYIIEAYDELSTPVFTQNGKYIYYIRIPNTHIFLQCLNPLSSVEPKCLTIKERY